MKRIAKARFSLGATTPPPADNTSETYKAVGNVVTVNGPNASKQMVDTTDMMSAVMEFHSDIADLGAFTITGQYSEQDEGIILGRDDARLSGRRRWGKLESLNRGDSDALLSTEDCLVEVQDFTKEESRGGVVTFNMTVKIVGPITITLPAPS